MGSTSDFMQRVGKHLKVRRERLGLTQGQLAERARLSVKMIGAVERGERYPSGATMAKLEVVLGNDLSDLLALAEPDPIAAELHRVVGDAPPMKRELVLGIAKLVVSGPSPTVPSGPPESPRSKRRR